MTCNTCKNDFLQKLLIFQLVENSKLTSGSTDATQQMQLFILKNTHETVFCLNFFLVDITSGVEFF